MSDAANASNCSLRMLRVVESGSRSSLEEEGFVSEGRPVIPYRLCKSRTDVHEEYRTPSKQPKLTFANCSHCRPRRSRTQSNPLDSVH